MPTWEELSEANAKAAGLLARDPVACRAAVSRAYYAVYQLVTSELLAAGCEDFGMLNGRRRNNPSHQTAPKLARERITRLSRRQRDELGQALRRLRVLREAADYMPRETIDEASVTGALRDIGLCRLMFSGKGRAA